MTSRESDDIQIYGQRQPDISTEQRLQLLEQAYPADQKATAERIAQAHAESEAHMAALGERLAQQAQIAATLHATAARLEQQLTDSTAEYRRLQGEIDTLSGVVDTMTLADTAASQRLGRVEAGQESQDSAITFATQQAATAKTIAQQAQAAADQATTTARDAMTDAGRATTAAATAQSTATEATQTATTARTTADQTSAALSALSSRVTPLETRRLVIEFKQVPVTGSLALGGTRDFTVTWPVAMPTGYGVEFVNSTDTTFGKVEFMGVVGAPTATSAVVRLRATAALTLSGSMTLCAFGWTL